MQHFGFDKSKWMDTFGGIAIEMDMASL